MDVMLIASTPNAEQVIEVAGRTAYQSFGHIAPSSEGPFIQMLLKNGHESVFEHASASFVLTLSRAASHQLVRHRIASYTQKSQRFCREGGFEYVIPPAINCDERLKSDFKVLMSDIQNTYDELIENGAKPEDARFVLPNACKTQIVITANFREWRHIIMERAANPAAQWEIRQAISQVTVILAKLAPNVFSDFQIEQCKDGSVHVYKIDLMAKANTAKKEPCPTE